MGIKYEKISITIPSVQEMINMILGQVQISPNTEIFKTDDNGEIILDENKNPTVIDYILEP